MMERDINKPQKTYDYNSTAYLRHGKRDENEKDNTMPPKIVCQYADIRWSNSSVI